MMTEKAIDIKSFEISHLDMAFDTAFEDIHPRLSRIEEDEMLSSECTSSLRESLAVMCKYRCAIDFELRDKTIDFELRDKSIARNKKILSAEGNAERLVLPTVPPKRPRLDEVQTTPAVPPAPKSGYTSSPLQGVQESAAGVSNPPSIPTTVPTMTVPSEVKESGKTALPISTRKTNAAPGWSLLDVMRERVALKQAILRARENAQQQPKDIPL